MLRGANVSESTQQGLMRCLVLSLGVSLASVCVFLSPLRAQQHDGGDKAADGRGEGRKI